MKTIPPAPKVWKRVDGTTVSCTESVRVLTENWEEAAESLSEFYEDAVLLGVGKAEFKQALKSLIDQLECDWEEKTAPVESLPKEK